MLKRKKSRLILLTGYIATLLSACASTANSQSPSPEPNLSSYERNIQDGFEEAVPASNVCPPVTPSLCEPELDLATDAALRKLMLGNEWHKSGRYTVSMDAYESVLVEHASLLADAYALWGIIALRLDRDNPGYDRDKAQTVAYVLDQRIRDAQKDEAAAEARLLWFSAQVMLEADVSKDNVVAENRHLRKELAQREEAIQRLRELTVGR